MAINDVKSALLTDLATITVANGYQTTVDTVFKIPKTMKDIQNSDVPAFAVSLFYAEVTRFDEAGLAYNLYYGIEAFNFVSHDVDKDSLVEQAMVKMFEDVVRLFTTQTSTVYLRDEVEALDILDFYLDTQGNKGYALIPIKITCK